MVEAENYTLKDKVEELNMIIEEKSKKIMKLEVENTELEDNKRITDSSLESMQDKIDKMTEKLLLLNSEYEELKDTYQIDTERLRQQLKDLMEEVKVKEILKEREQEAKSTIDESTQAVVDVKNSETQMEVILDEGKVQIIHGELSDKQLQASNIEVREQDVQTSSKEVEPKEVQTDPVLNKEKVEMSSKQLIASKNLLTKNYESSSNRNSVSSMDQFKKFILTSNSKPKSLRLVNMLLDDINSKLNKISLNK